MMEQIVHPQILLVEDSMNDAELFKWGVKQVFPEVELIWCRNKEETMDYLYRKGKYQQYAQTPLPALIFIDLKLAGTYGLDILSEIRRDRQFDAIWVSIWATVIERADVEQAVERGINDYFIKRTDTRLFVEDLKKLAHHFPSRAHPSAHK